MTHTELFEFAQAIQKACIEAAGEGFEEAGISGLCREGAIEFAQDSIRSVSIEHILDTFLTNHPDLTDEVK